MPLTKKGREIKSAMVKEYGAKKGEQVFYASKNAHKISGVDKGFYGHMNPAAMQTQSIKTSVRHIFDGKRAV